MSLSQEAIDVLAVVLYRAENVFRAVDPFCEVAERTSNVLTELRQECTRAGAQDPFPFLPMRCEHPDGTVAA